MIDTHCHIYSQEFDKDRTDLILNARNENISYILMPNVDCNSIIPMLEVEENFDFCLSMMGLHPCSIKSDYKNQLKIVAQWFDKRKFLGVGETGIDLYWDKSFVDEQIRSFEYQIDIAKSLNIPVIIHSRDSLDLTIECISKKQNGDLKAVFHCFNGTIEQARKIKDLGCFIGLGGVVTYKNADMGKIVVSNGLENVVLETDSPYLPPVPHRGKRNEPSYIRFVAQKISEFLETDVNHIIEATDMNAKMLFGLNG